MDTANKIMAQLLFGIDGIKIQMETIEKWANQTAMTAQQAFAKANLGTPQQLATQKANQTAIQTILQQGKAKELAIFTAGETELTAIKAKEALTRQAIAHKEAQTELAIARKQMAEEKLLYMQARRSAFDDKPQGFAGLMERRASWLVTGGLVMGGLAGLAGTISTIKDVEMGMTVIARITEDATFNFKKMRDEVMQLGVEYGQTFDVTSDIAIRWAQAGYSIADTMELTKTALLALNTAELDAEYATQGFIAIMAQWNIEAENLLPVVDKINKTADDYAITSQDLVDGLNRVGAAAKNAGLTIEETIGSITVLREASGRTGKEVGTALNTIFSYMTRQKTIKLMETLGISVFEDEARTTFRSIIDLMKELASHWQGVNASSPLMADLETELLESFNDEMATAVGLQEEWNDVQQRDISQAAAGVRRKNFFISLMSRFSEIQGVINGQLDAEGYSLAENERTMGTLEKQVESLKAAAEKLAVAIGDAGLLEGLTGLAMGTKDAIEWFNNFDDDMQGFLITVGKVTVAVKLLDVALKSTGVSVVLNKGLKTEATIVGLSALIPKLTQAAKGVTGLGIATAGASVIFSGFGAVLRGLLAFVGGPFGATLIGLGIAFGFIHNKVKKAREEMEELPDSVQTMQAQFSAIQGLGKEYDTLSSKIAQTAEEKGKLADVTVKLGKIFPESISNIDKEGNAIELNNDVLRESIRLKEEELSLDRQKLAKQFSDFEKSAVGKEAKNNIEKIKELEKQVESSARVLERYREIFGEDGIATKGEQREIDLVKQSLQESRIELNKFNQEQLKTEQDFRKMALAALDTNDSFSDLSDTLKNQFIKSIRDMSKDVFGAQKKIEALMSQDSLPGYIEQMDTAFKDFNKTTKEAKDIEELNKDFVTFRNEIIATGKEIGITGDESVRLAYAIMGTQDPAATAELKMWQLSDIVQKVGETGMNSAQLAAKASNILASNVSAATLKTIAAHWDDIKAVRDRAKAYEILAQAIFLEDTKGGLASGMGGTTSTIRQRTEEMQGYLDAYSALDGMVRGGGGPPSYPPPNPDADKKKKTADWLTPFIDGTLAAAEAQKRLNDAMKRGLDGMDAKRSVMMDSARTMAEYLDGMGLQASFESQYKEQQKSLHAEANLYRAAIEVLEAKQRTLNTSTDKGREAYAKIGDEIEKARQKVDELSKTWWQVEGMQRAISSDRYRVMDEWIQKLADGGAITLEQEYDLYEQLGKSNLLYADRAQLQERLVDIGKKLIEQEIDKQIKALEAEKEAFKTESDARIKAIQKRIDLLDEENDRLKEQTRIMEAQRDITDAQQALTDAQAKLENVKGEKDTRIWQDGRWEYIANPEAVRQAEKEVKSAQERLIDKQNAFNDLMLQIQQDQYRKELEAQIQAEKEKQDEQLKAYDARKKELETADEEIIKIMNEGGQNADTELQNILTTINISMSDKLMEILQTVRSYASQMRSEFMSIARAASEAGVDMGGILPGFDKGGPIPSDMAIKAHAGEYMLNKRDVDDLGGFAGVEKLRTAIRLPSFKMIGAGNVVRTSNASSVKNDNRVVIENANFPHVVDGSGLIRNLKQLASA